jgi:hypothetical protein
MIHVMAFGLLNRMLQLATSYKSDSANDVIIVTAKGSVLLCRVRYTPT